MQFTQKSIQIFSLLINKLIEKALERTHQVCIISSTHFWWFFDFEKTINLRHKSEKKISKEHDRVKNA